MPAPLFNLRGLFEAVDAERNRRGLSWAAMAREVGVAASTLRRFGEADDAEADGVLATLRWLGVAPEDHLRDGSPSGALLPSADGGHVRVDMELVAMANGDPRGARGRTRTSIQRLVEAARRSGQPVAALTRLTDA